MHDTYRFTSRASIDVREHLDWQSANVSSASAEVWIQELLRQADIIASDPMRWPLARESQRLDVELREAPLAIRGTKTHRILFTMIAGAIEIVAVRHVARVDLTNDDLSG